MKLVSKKCSPRFKRSIVTYETTGTKPRGNTVRKFASALNVSVDYLLNDEITDPKYGIEKAPYIEEARERLGNKAAKEMDVLLEQNVALFAGGALDQEAKDAFFEAVMKAYLKCKEEAKKPMAEKRKRIKNFFVLYFQTDDHLYRSLSVLLYRHFDLMIVSDC